MKIFRDLTTNEIIEFQQWARDNYKPFTSINGMWHPVVQQECVQINRNAILLAEPKHSQPNKK